MGFKDEPYFPAMQVLEHVMPLVFEGFYCEIVPREDFPPEKHADTDVANRCIRVREDIYARAADGYGRDRMTIVHEIAHYILLVVCGVRFDRAFGDEPVERYKDPEWHAKALAGEIMCPVQLIGDLSAEQVVKACGVSYDAARYNIRVQKGGGVH